MDKISLSNYGRDSVRPSPVNRMMADFDADFRDDLDINLGVGYVNEKTIPTEFIEQAMHNVIAGPQKYRQAFNYGGPKGSQNLIDSIKTFILKNKIAQLTEDVLNKNEVIIGPSGATSLLEALAQILPKGLVITSDPVYYIYSDFLLRAGFEIVAVPEDHEGIRTDLLQETLDSLGNQKNNISFIYLVTINNPTCTILSDARRKQLVNITADLSKKLNRKIPLFLDKAYENLIHDETVTEPSSSLLYDPIGVVYEIYTLSKIIAPALRIGYMLGPPSDFTQAMVQRTSDIGFSASLICQEIASYILDHHAAEQIQSVKSGYHKKAEQTKNWLDEFLAPFLADFTGGQAGFYYYLTFKDIQTHEDSPFFKFLTRTTGDPQIDGLENKKNPRVIYIPGSFCVHPEGQLTQIAKRQLRLSYGFEELKNIKKAIQLMNHAAIYANKNL
jgi:DNA-binding transcriptional MocR family regulator